MAASNNISGSHTAEMDVRLTDKPSGGSINCDNAQIFGKNIECRGSIKRGYPVNALFSFGDGFSEMIHPSMYFKFLLKNSFYL